MNLETSYLGMKLRSPLVPSASPLCGRLDTLKRMEDAGASAVVLNSLFEEQIRAHLASGSGCLDDPRRVPLASAHSSFPDGFATGPEEYLEHIGKAKQGLGIPVIASLNGTSFGGWTAFSRQIEQAGADALELNFYSVPSDADRSGEDIEAHFLTLFATIRAQIKIPIAVKLSPYFTSLVHFVRRLDWHGADGIVLFNRFCQPDISLEHGEITSHANFSTSQDLRLPLRWIGILRSHIRASLAGTSGVHTGVDALKLMMVGADVTMLCSSLMRYGAEHIRNVESEMTVWMATHGFESIEQLKGSFSQQRVPDPAAFERAQYVRAIGAFSD